MQADDFNSEAAAPVYGYCPSPVQDGAFLILKYGDDRARTPVPVGDYTVLDRTEEPSLSEKSVMNLVSAMNGRKTLIPLAEDANTRTLYHIAGENEADGKTNIIFYTLGRRGVSVENALLRLERSEYVV